MPLTAETILKSRMVLHGRCTDTGLRYDTENQFRNATENYIPFIRNLTVGNEGDEDISDVRLTIAFDPAFAKTFTYDISCVPSGKSVEISPLRIILGAEMLFSLTEAVSGTVSFSLSKDEKELYRKGLFPFSCLRSTNGAVLRLTRSLLRHL